MKKFKDLKQKLAAKLDEALEYHHIDRADSWDAHGNVSDQTREHMHKVFNGQSHVDVPLEHHSGTHDPDVLDHFANHAKGWKIHDYHAGTASQEFMTRGNPEKGIAPEKKTRIKSIGSVLQETGASKEIQQSFANDPTRRSATKTGEANKVVISAHPHAVMSMTPPDSKNWGSCMHPDNGCNRHYLRHESENGTHVAFLTHKDDHGPAPDAPIARIAMKPYHGIDSTGNEHTIFRPENRAYGKGTTAFEHTVHQWAEKNYPAKEGVRYHKNDSVYDDTGNDTFYKPTKHEIESNINQGMNIANNGEHVDHESLTHAVNHGTSTIKHGAGYSTFADNMSQHRNLAPEHVAKIIDSAPEDKKSYVMDTMARAHGDKLTSRHLNEYMEKSGGPNQMWGKALANPKLPDSAVDQLHPDHYGQVKPSKIKDHHLDKVLDNYEQGNSGSSYPVSDNLDKFKDHHISRLANIEIAKGDDRVSGYIPAIMRANRPSADTKREITNKVMENGSKNPRLRRVILANSEHITPDHIANMGADRETMRSAMSNEKHSPETTKALKNEWLKMPQMERRAITPSQKVADAMDNNDVQKVVQDHVEGQHHLTLPKSLSNKVMDGLEDHIHKTSEKIKDMEENDEHEDEHGEMTPEYEQHGKHLQHLLEVHGNAVQNHLDDHHDYEDDIDKWHEHGDMRDLDRQGNRIDKMRDIYDEHSHPHVDSYNYSAHDEAQEKLQHKYDAHEQHEEHQYDHDDWD